MNQKSLKPKEKRFISEFLLDNNATQSAIRAGYSRRSARQIANRLMTKDYIRCEIDGKLRKIEEKILVTKEFVIGGLKEVAERCMQHIPVMVFDKEKKLMTQKIDEGGEGVWEFDSSGANRSFELLGKHLSLFVDRTDITTNGKSLIELLKEVHDDA